MFYTSANYDDSILRTWWFTPPPKNKIVLNESQLPVLNIKLRENKDQPQVFMNLKNQQAHVPMPTARR